MSGLMSPCSSIVEVPLEVPLSDRVVGRLPVSAQRLEELLRGEGLARPPRNLAQLARLCRVQAGRVPFRVVRCGGMEIAVARAEHAVATSALRLVRHWGLVSVQAVMDRARALTTEPVTAPTAFAVLDALLRTRWLGADRRWFSFLDPHGQLETSLGKIFSIAPRVRLDELRAALAKGLPGAQHAPTEALGRYLVDLGRCTIDGVFVRRAPAAGTSRPTRQEAAVVKLLEAAGRELEIGVLRRRARAVGLPRTTVNQLVRLSPLFRVSGPASGQRRVGLIGDGRVAIYA
jgi:hypothetical protein